MKQTLLVWMSDVTKLLLEWMSGRLISGRGRLGAEGGTEGWLCIWLCCFSGAWAFTSIKPAARFLWAAIWERTLSALPPGGIKQSKYIIWCVMLQECQDLFGFVCVGVNLNGCGSPGLSLPLHWSLLRSEESGSDQSWKERRKKAL